MDFSPDADPFGLPVDTALDTGEPVALRPTRRRAPLWAIVGFLVVLVVVGGGAFMARAWLSGTSQTAAEWIPASTNIYVGADLLRLQSEDLQTLLEAFGQPSGQSLIDDLDRQLNEQYGMAFESDVKPWLGRTIAFAGNFDIQMATDTAPGDMMFAVEVRDDAKADGFLDRFAAAESLNEEAIGQGRLWSSGGADPWIWHGDGVILVGDLSMIETAMDIDPSSSLAALPEFQTMTSKLRRSRAITMYVDGTSLLAGSGIDTGVPGGIGAMAAAVDFSSDGFILDAIQTQPQYAGDIYNLGSDAFLASLDEQTVGFVRVGSASDLYDAAITGLDRAGLFTEGDVSAETQLEDQFGFDVVNGLIRKLDRPTGIAVRLHQGDTFGVVAAFGTTQPDEVAAAASELADVIANQTGVVVGDLGGTGPVDAVMGVVGEWLAIGSDRADVRMLEDVPSAPLTETPRYVQAVSNLPDGEHVVAYVDLRSLLYHFGGEYDLPAGLNALTALAVGQSSDGEYQRATFFLTINGQAASSSSSDRPGSLAATGLTN
jgi:hypothetical protein